LFAPLGQAYIVSILASLVVSITLTPVMSYYMLPKIGRTAQHEGWLVRVLKRAYGATLARAYDHRNAILVTALLLPAREVISLLVLHMVMVAFVVLNVAPEYFPVSVMGGAALNLVVTGLALRWQQYQQMLEQLRRQALAAQNATFHIIERYSDEVVMILNPDLTIRYASANAERVIGVAASTMQGASFIQAMWTQYLTPEAVQTVLAQGTARPLAGQDAQSVIAFQRPDGRRLWLEATTSAIPAKPGAAPSTIDGVVLMMRDITARKEAEDALQHERNLLRTLIDSLPDTIYVIDRAQKVILYNTAAEAFFWQLTSQPITAWQNRPDPTTAHTAQQVMADNAAVLHGKTIREQEMLVPLADGTQLPVAVTKIPLYDASGAITGALVRGRDISAQKAAQAAAIAQAQEQERLTLALRQEQKLNALKTLFMTLISHEFRTPLAKMQTALDLLERYSTRLSPAGRAERFRSITDQIGVLKEMLEDITIVLDLQMRAAVLNPQPTNLPDFGQQVIDDLHNISQTHPIHLVTSGQMQGLLLDHRMLRYILRNLLSNAIKYSPEGAPVLLEFHYQVNSADAPGETPDSLLLRVTDRGIGLTAEDLRQLFQPFYRSEHAQNISGTGLGLKIVYDCVTLLGGTVTATGSPSAGAQFTVIIPVKNTPIPPSRADA